MNAASVAGIGAGIMSTGIRQTRKAARYGPADVSETNSTLPYLVRKKK